MNRSTKTWLITTLVSLIGLVLAISAVAAEQQENPEKLAVVNGAVITQEEFQNELEPFLQRMAMSGQKPEGDQLSEIKKNILENLINRELLYQVAKEKGIEADSEAIKEQFQQLKQRFPDEAQFQAMLDQLGITAESLKEQIAQRLMIQQVIEQEVGKDVTVTDGEAREFYKKNPKMFQQPEKVRASHILIKVDPDAESSEKKAAREKLEGIQEKVESGEDFGELAKAHSEGPSSTKGGDLGFFGHGQMVKAFEEVAFGLETGEVSDIVETRFGYHLIKGTGSKPAGTVPYEEVEEQLETYLKEQKVQKQVADYIETLKSSADIKRFM
jgi:peptidyl-prolyl cis-trans isomerase C